VSPQGCRTLIFGVALGALGWSVLAAVVVWVTVH
jgi:hypothetical protein